MTHTPGPWRLAPASAYSDPDLNIDAGVNGTGAYICKVGIRGDVQAEADARLIAAAPDLLDALEYILSAHGEQIHDACDMARKAIAKARGAAPIASRSQIPARQRTEQEG